MGITALLFTLWQSRRQTLCPTEPQAVLLFAGEKNDSPVYLLLQPFANVGNESDRFLTATAARRRRDSGVMILYASGGSVGTAAIRSLS